MKEYFEVDNHMEEKFLKLLFLSGLKYEKGDKYDNYCYYGRRKAIQNQCDI